MIEPLEKRRLLAFSSISANGATVNVSYTNNADNDVVEVILSGGNIQVRDGSGVVRGQISASGKNLININTFGGNDFVRIGRADGTLMPPGLRAVFDGGEGNDTLIGGNSTDTLRGSGGNDRLDGRAAGDRMEGGAGFDTADYASRARSINVSLENSGTANDGSTLGNNSTPAEYNDNGSDNLVDMEAVIGSSNPDFIRGNSAANWLEGGGGNDTMFGGAGIDTITGGTAVDLGYGEDDADFFFFQDSTADQFLGGTGTTSAQFDAVDTPAPALPASASESLKMALFAELVEEEPGELIIDDTFDVNGAFVDPLDQIIVRITDVTVQNIDGQDKIVVVGTAQVGVESDYDFLVARFNADGSLDETFGNEELGEQGVVVIDFENDVNFSATDDEAKSVVVDSENRIVVVGGSSYTASNDDSIDMEVSEYAAARLNEDGTLDEDFATGGKYWGTPDGALTYDEATRVAVQWVDIGDGFFEERYVITGTNQPGFGFASFSEFAEDTESADWLTIRLDDQGATDGSFGEEGIVLTQFFDIESPTDEYVTGLAIDPETGNIWLSGTQYVDWSGRFAIAGYTADGAPIDGAVNFYGFEDFEGVFGVEAADSVIAGNRLIVVGLGYQGEGPTRAAMAAFSIDPDDAALQLGASTVHSDSSMSFAAVAVDSMGSGVLAGNIGDNYWVTRFETETLSLVGNGVVYDFAGSLDKEFTYDVATGIAIGSDDSVIVVGEIDDPLLGMVKLVNEEPEEPPFVDVPLDGPTVQALPFFIAGNPTDPVPTYLVDRLKSLRPDGTVELSGTEFDDVICVSEKDGIVTISINGELFQYTASQVKKVLIHGLGGNDVIKADDDFNIPVEFDGGSGNDLMIGGKNDDSFKGGSGHDVVFGLRGNDTMQGDGDNDILVGGLGNDRIFGNAGRDLLIGGLGRDELDGGLGEDIVIGGFTIYDLVAELLLKLRDEWGNSSRNSSQRFGNLSGPGLGRGLNGLLFLKPNLTVYNDGESDKLTGGGDDDWFIADNKGGDADQILDKTSKDHLSTH